MKIIKNLTKIIQLKCGHILVPLLLVLLKYLERAVTRNIYIIFIKILTTTKIYQKILRIVIIKLEITDKIKF